MSLVIFGPVHSTYYHLADVAEVLGRHFTSRFEGYKVSVRLYISIIKRSAHLLHFNQQPWEYEGLTTASQVVLNALLCDSLHLPSLASSIHCNQTLRLGHSQSLIRGGGGR